MQVKIKAVQAQGKGNQAPSPVTVTVVKSALVENNILITGDVIANEEVELRPEMSGKIVSINFTEGAFVRKGQLLVKINDADLQANLRKLTRSLKYRKKKKVA
ncbi:MAG: biotin/lipoyl-binding protein [Sphingobacteriales bacterium JAD_PAG50586_3]|nr:MAG: biotin/lipoyl-binding protein [Sphingobacteriales bacterium JAD_PAG50586_3]